MTDLRPFRTRLSGKVVLRYGAAYSDLKFLAEYRQWFGDGTFTVAPGYKQQYTLHAYFGGITYPCVCAFSPVTEF